MCVKFPSGDLNPDPCSHTSQIFIFVEKSLHQGCAIVVMGIFDLLHVRQIFYFIFIQ